MATSGYRDEWVTAYDTLRFSWWQTGQSIEGNYTNISWSLSLIASSNGYISSSATKSYWVNVNGSYYEGTNTVGISSNTTKILASGSTTIYHDANGSKSFSYSFSQYFGINFNGSIGSVSGSGTGTLEPIPRKATFTSVSNFDDITGPTIYFNHPAGSALQLQACIKSGDTFITSYRVIDGTKGYYTFNLNEYYGPGDSTLNRIWNKSIVDGKDTINVTFYLATWMGTYFEYVSSDTVTCTITDCEPTLNPTVKDEGTISSVLTGNPNTMIRGYNILKAMFNATAKKGASIVEKKVTCGNQILTNDGYFNYVHNNTFTFYIKDSRGKTKTVPITLPAIDYVTVSCNTSYDTDLADDNTATINTTFSGTYFNASFGNEHNKLTLEYRYRKNNEDFPVDDSGNAIWTTVKDGDITKADGKFEYSISLITGADYKDTYIIQARVFDKIKPNGIYAAEQIVKIVPVFDWSEDDFNFNVPVSIQGKKLDIRDRIARAYTQEEVTYQVDSCIKLFRSDSPTDLYNQNIATFNNNGTITIKKDMIALVNIHIPAYALEQRTWVRFINYESKWQYTASINYGDGWGCWTTTCINIVLPLKKDTILALAVSAPMIINSGGPSGSYIEIIEL